MKKIKVQIKGREKLIIKLLKGLRVNIYDIKHMEGKSIYLVSYNDLRKIPKGLIINQDLTLKDKIYVHKEFILGIFLSLIFIIVLSHIIFSIKIMHNDKYIRNITKKELERYGLKPLTFRKNYGDLNQIKKKILSDYKDVIEWIEIESKGMTYIVKLEKRIITKEKKEEKYCDIVSTKDAIIKSINSSKGQNKFDVGDYVLKGETIISGNIMFNEEVKTRVCAEGDVIGNTWYNVNIKYPRSKLKKIYTNKTSYNIAISHNKKLVSIFRIHFKRYDLKRILLFKVGSFKVYKEVALEYKLKKVNLSESFAKKEALKLASKRLLESLNTNPKIISRKVLQSYEYNSIINMDIFYSIDEIISTKEIKDIKNEKEEEG